MQNLIIYKFNPLYHILNELNLDLNFKIFIANDENSLNDIIKNLNNYLIISNKEYLNSGKQFIIENFPINIFKLVEKLNIKFLKIKFSDQSQIIVKNYEINLNSREISLKNKKLKLTEKEIKILIYLFKAEKSINTEELQNKVWGYQSDLETHTVETHIYRLRKKFSSFFNDDDFILSDKNGYKIK